MAMADCELGIGELEKEEDLIAAAKQIAKALGSRKSLTEEARKILSDLGTQLSSISMSVERESESASEIERLLDSVQDKVMSWEADEGVIWESSFEEWTEFLTVVDEATRLTERLESMCSIDSRGDSGDDLDRDRNCELQRRAQDVLQTAMDILEEEFRHLLVQNKKPYEPEHQSFRSSEGDEVSVDSFGDDSNSVEEQIPPPEEDNLLIDLIRPEVIPEVRIAADSMFAARYDKECVQAYTSLRKEALDECLISLEIEKLSIEDVLRAEWKSLNSKIKRWIRAMKVFIPVCLFSEKRLSDRIFAGFPPEISATCFVESSKTAVLQLLNFGEAMSVGPQKPEKLFRIIDMYEVLSDLIPDLESLYDREDAGESGFSVAAECREVLGRLGSCVRSTFLEFEHAVASNRSNNPISGGGIHPLTSYVMNYMKTLTDNSDTFNRLFEEEITSVSPAPSLSPSSSPARDEESGRAGTSPMARSFLSLVTSLQRNLDTKSALYRDVSLQHLFMMNNLHYMAQKAKGPDLRPIFGDEWIRKCNGRFQQHAIDYQRSSWGSILALLKEDGTQSTGGSKWVLRLRERFRSFYAAFEELYRVQTAWTIPDKELREDVRISTSLNVIQAYRVFESRHFNHVSERHIKYSADDLERFILDLFEGSVKTLQTTHSRR